MLRHRTNRADVLAAFERMKKITGDWKAVLVVPNFRYQDYILRGRSLSGNWWTAKEAYLAISRFCDQLEAKEAGFA